ncbi:MAG TPA: YqaE/Pmp3 family membrane protein [Spirillospora sp.]|nr:YqaE/Pmp3 family membrane protein [Spirillospora sp.]
MSLGRALLCLLFPPLAVIDRGCGTILIVFALTLAGWIPGAIAALLINYMAEKS